MWEGTERKKVLSTVAELILRGGSEVFQQPLNANSLSFPAPVPGLLQKGRMKSQDVIRHAKRAGLRVVLHHSTDTAAEYVAASANSICKVSQVTGFCAGATDAGV